MVRKAPLILLCAMSLAMCLADNVQAGAKVYEPSAEHISYAEDGMTDVYSMGIDNNDQVLISSYGNPAKVKRVDPNGHSIDLTLSMTAGGAVHPRAAIQDASGNYVVPVITNSTIERFQSDGTFINSFSTTALPTYIVEDDDGYLWVSENPVIGMVLRQYDPCTGAVLQTFSSTGLPQRGTIDFVGGMHMYDGLLYVADAGRMIKFDPCDPAGTVTEAIAANDYWGGNFWEVAGIDITPDGRIYVLENVNKTVKIYDASLPANANYIQTISDVLLNEAMTGVGVDAAGTVYVGENGAWPNVMKFVAGEDDDDADGVGNSVDLCPNTPLGAPVDSSGCSIADTDGDGVLDPWDQCPGSDPCLPVNSVGCTDTDEDGVADTEDSCPDTPAGAEVDAVGCELPDTDGDGVYDVYDVCPGTAAGLPVNAQGCDDADGDGVYKPYDLCEDPDANNPVNADGCIDTDQDGVTDADDLCPNTPPATEVNAEGCADADGDGVKDADDLCPDTPPHWPVDFDGCPLPTPPAKAARIYEPTKLVIYPTVSNIGTSSLAISGSGDPCYMVIVGEDPPFGWHAFNTDTGVNVDQNYEIVDLDSNQLWVGGMATDPTDSDIVWIKGHLLSGEHWFLAHGSPTSPFPGAPMNFLQPTGNPGAIAIDAFGKIWAACGMPGAVRRYDRNTGAVLTTIADTPGLERTTWSWTLGGIDIDLSTGWIYVSDGTRVVRFDPCDPAGTMQHFAGNATTGSSAPGEFGTSMYSPGQIHVADDGRVYVTDPNNARIQVFDRDRVFSQGNFIQIIKHPTGGFNWWDSKTIKGVTVDPLGHVYISEGGSGPSLHKFIFDPCYVPPGCAERLAELDAGTATWSWANRYLDADDDCHIGLGDLSLVLIDWLGCTEPGVAGCKELPASADILGIPKATGAITIDGDLTEPDWIDPCWMDLDYVYYHGADPGLENPPDPCDITSAKYALLWDPDPCVIYLAVKVVDTDHVLKLATNWDDSDRIEIYMQGDPNGGSDWGTFSTNADFDKAQQYATGDKGPGYSGDDWGVFGNGASIPGVGSPDDAGFIYKVKVSGSEIHYEIQVKPWIWYGGNSGSASVPRELDIGVEIGFDVIVGSRYGYGSTPEPGGSRPEYTRDCNDPNWAPWCAWDEAYNMLSENDMTGKFQDAGQFRRYVLQASLSDPLPCGGWGYLRADSDQDCDVDLDEFDALQAIWGDCIDPGDPACLHPWE